MMRTDYACNGSEDEVIKGVLRRVTSKTGQGFQGNNLQEVKIAVTREYPSEVDSRDGTRDEASARTQVYLSKTKLQLQVGI